MWAALRRRSLPALITLIAIAGGAIAAAFLWPPTFTSIGTILIEQQELPADLVRSTVSTYASQRIQIISQRVMTTETLLGIIQRYNLYADLRRRKPREEVIAAMRKATNLQMISADVIDPRDGHPTKATIAFSLSYSNRSADLAAQVANELVSLYLQQNIESRQKSAQDAVSFLKDESERLSRDIDDLQARIAKFKGKNANDLPELTQLNLTGLNQMQAEILETDTQLQSGEQQLIFLDAQLAQINPTAQIYDSTGQRVQSPADLLKSLRSEYARDSALYAPDHPDVARLKREIAALEAAGPGNKPQDVVNEYRRELEDAQAQLNDAKHRYSADHPDVIRAQRLVDSLQQKLTDATRTAPSSAPSETGPDATVGADNPAYIQLRAQREAVASQRKALEDKRATLQGRFEEYERRLASTPAVEREYSELLANLSSAQIQYSEAKHKQMEADIADNLENERKGEHFSLIEPPLAPEEPASPNRPLIIVFGMVAGVAAALGIVALLEGLDGSVRGVQDLERLVEVPPLAVIPRMLNNLDLRARRRHRRYAMFGTVTGLVFSLLAVHIFYRPLDVLWAIAMRHLGILT
jgi:succinoglycan biosynthesis transport protein ExoP